MACLGMKGTMLQGQPLPPLQQVSTQVDHGLSTQAEDLPLLLNADATIIASRGRPKQFDRWTTKRPFLDRFALYQMVGTRRGAHTFKAKALNSDFGNDGRQLGYAAPVQAEWKVLVGMEPINPLQDSKLGEGFTHVPRIRFQNDGGEQAFRELEDRLSADRHAKFFHPAVHPSGRLLVYSACLEDKELRYQHDGTGGTDLWYVVFDEGVWGKPTKFDARVNSPGDEVYASFSADGTLWFSSNRAGGLGGYDIYRVPIDLAARLQAKSHSAWWDFAEPTPLSSPADDLALVWQSDAGTKHQSGLLARNQRAGGIDTDINRFTFNGPRASGTILSETDRAPIPGATAVYVSNTGDTLTAQADERGHYELLLRYGKNYQRHFEADMHLASPLEVVSTIAMEQGADMPVEEVVLASIVLPQNVIKGTVTALDGRNLLPQVSLSFFSPDSEDIAPQMQVRGDHFIVMADRNLDFYIDVALPTPTENTFHYIPEAYQAGDTVFADIILDDSTVDVRRIIVALEGTPNVPGIPIAKLLYFPKEHAEAVTLGWDIGTDLQTVRTGVPLPQTSRCSLLVARSGYIPAVIDHRTRNAMIDTVRLVPVETRYLEPIVIHHKLNDQNPDFQLSAGDLEGISQYLIMEPEARLLVTAHTDCRGSDAYNLGLSRRRAEMVKTFILRRTDLSFAGRITTSGVGEAKPAVACDCASGCTEQDHATNRRTEILLERPLPQEDLYSGN